MLAWIEQNLVTLIVSAALLLVIGFAVYYTFRKDRGGTGGCTGNCAGCRMGCASQKKTHK